MGLYAAYYGAIGTLSLWLPGHFRELGASGRWIGFLLAVGPLAACVVPLMVGHFADRSRGPVLVLRGLSGLALVFIAGLVISDSFVFAALAASAMSIAMCSLPTLTDSMTIHAVDRSAHRYGRVRSLGSVGFVAATAGHGLWVASAPKVALMFVAGVFAASLWARSAEAAQAETPGLGEAADLLLSDGRLRALLVVLAIHWAATGPYLSFLPLVTKDFGFSGSAASMAFAVAATAEVAGMWLVRSRAGVWLAATFFLSSVRWGVTALATSEGVWLAAQTVHALTFGAFVVAAQRLVVARVPERLRSTGQGLFFSVVFGAGGGLGSIASGFGYEAAGGSAIFLGAALTDLVALGALIGVLGIRGITSDD